MDKIETFRALHVPGDPLVLFNIWDAGSASAVAAAGAKAIATGSYGVACARGSSRSDRRLQPHSARRQRHRVPGVLLARILAHSSW